MITIKMYDNREMGVMRYFFNLHYSVTTVMIIVTPVDIRHGGDYIAV